MRLTRLSLFVLLAIGLGACNSPEPETVDTAAEDADRKALKEAVEKEKAEKAEKVKKDAKAKADAKAAEDALQPEAILRRTVEYYKNLRDFQVDVTQGYRTDGASEPEATYQFSIMARRPNQFAIRGEDILNVVCEGENCFLSSPQLEKFSETLAPETLEAVVADNELRVAMHGRRPYLLNFLQADAYMELMRGVTLAERLGMVRVDNDENHHLRLNGPTREINLLISTGIEPVVRRVSIVPNTDEVEVERAPATAPKKTDAPAAKRGLHEYYKNWRVNANLATFAFAFSPPEGASKVASLVWEADPQSNAPRWANKAAPPIELPLLDGASFKLADYRDKHVVVLDFWLSTRDACAQQLPLVAEVVADYQHRGVALCAVNYKQNEATVRAFLRAHDLKDIVVALDLRGEASYAYSRSTFPTLVIIDKQGRIRSSHGGMTDELTYRLRAELDAVLRESELSSDKLERLTSDLAISELIESLMFPDQRIRDKAGEALAGKGAEAVPDLTKVLDNPDATIRLAAIKSLGQIGLPASTAAEPLIKLLEDRDSSVRAAAADTLGRIGPPLPKLFAMLDKGNISVRIGAARALGQAGANSKEAVERLIVALTDRDKRVQSAAIRALASAGEAAVPALIAALESNNQQRQSGAATSLGRMGAPAVPALIAALGHPQVHVRYQSALALGQMGAAAQPAINALNKATKDPDTNVRYYAVHALRKIPPEKNGE